MSNTNRETVPHAGASSAQGTETEEGAEGRGKISGVFSVQQVRKVGTGTTSRKTIQKSFWFVSELADGTIELQLLNTNFIPAGPKKTLSKDQFLGTYQPEPEFYVTNVLPKIREVNKTVARGDRFRENGELFSAEVEYNGALEIDIENVRANFGLGITYLERGETDKAENILSRLVKLEAAFETEHKHLFNEFGISLRKTGLHSQAINYYKRALELSSTDENLYYNMARVYLDKKDMPNTLECLLKSISMNPRNEIAAKFLIWLLEKKLVPAALVPKAAEHLKLIKSAMSEGGAKTEEANQSAPTAPAAQGGPEAATKGDA